MGTLDLFGSWSREEIDRFISMSKHMGSSEDNSRRGKAQWERLSEEEKQDRLRHSFHSAEARAKSLEKRPEALRESWSRLSPEEREVRVEAAADGVRKVSEQRSESMRLYWAGKTEEERYQHYLNSFGSEEAGRVRAEAMLRVWAEYTPEEKLERLNRTVHSEEARQGRRKHWDALSEEEKEDWIRVHLMGKTHEPTFFEIIVGIWLEENRAGEWKYIGCSKEVIIGGRTPDFININGKKEVIEVFGSHWHPEEDVEQRKAHYRKYGYDCKIIWDYECLPEDIERILG